MNQAVTELIVRGRTEGVREARTEVEALERSHEKAQATIEKATLGMERMSARVQSRLDPQFRATQQLAKVEADLNLLRQKGLITLERQAALTDMARAKYLGLGTAAQLSAFQVQNLSFQMNDIAMGLATGQSPFTVMAQQGSQIVQIFGSGTGVVAALKASGAAMTSFLLNPLTLAAIGFGLALEAGMRFFSGIGDGASGVEGDLERHADLVRRIGDAWKEAEEASGRAMQALPAGLSFLASRQIETLESALRDKLSGLFGQGGIGGVFGQMPGLGGEFGIDNSIFDPRMADQFRDLADAYQTFQRQIEQGRDPVQLLLDFNEEISRLADSSSDPAFRQAAEDILRLTGHFDLAEGSATDLALKIDELVEKARGLDAAARSAKAFSDAMSALQGIAAPPRSDADRAAEQLRLAVKAAQGADDAAVALDAYHGALKRIEEAEAAAAARRARSGGAGSSGPDPAQRFNDILEQRRRALDEEAGALGLSGAALAKYRAETELTNAALEMFGQVSPEIAAQIAAIGDAAAAAAEQQRQMAEQIAAMDATRDAVRGFLGDFVGGLRQGESAVDALRSALDRLADRLLNMGLDMLVSGLLGQQGTAGGGIFGSLFGSLFSGASRGLSGGPTNIVPAGLSRGGPVFGAGTATSDSIPALLSNGEYVINAEQTRKFFSLLEAINDNQIPGFWAGGGVGVGGPGNTGNSGAVGGVSSGGISGGVGVGGPGNTGNSGAVGGVSSGGGSMGGVGVGGPGNTGNSGAVGGVGSGGGGIGGTGGPSGIGGLGGADGVGGVGSMGGMGDPSGIGVGTGGLGGIGPDSGGGSMSNGSANQAGKGDLGGFGFGADAFGGFGDYGGFAGLGNLGTPGLGLGPGYGGLPGSDFGQATANVAADVLGSILGDATGFGPRSGSASQANKGDYAGDPGFGTAGKGDFAGLPGSAALPGTAPGTANQVGKSDLGITAAQAIADGIASPAVNTAIADKIGQAIANSPISGLPTAGPSTPSTPSTTQGWEDTVDQLVAGWAQLSDFFAGERARLGFQRGRIGGVGGTLDRLFEPGGGGFADGGMVGANDNLRLASPAWFRNAVRAHGGMRLAPDERPIIAQTGERILNRAETADYERGGRRGGQGSATVLNFRGGDIIVQGSVDEKVMPMIRAEVAASEARTHRHLAQTVGQYQARWQTMKAG